MSFMSAKSVLDLIPIALDGINQIDKETGGAISSAGYKICEGIMDCVNNNSNGLLVTTGKDHNDRLALAVNNRPEIHYHNNFVFNISVSDNGQIPEVESMINRVVSAIPKK